MRTALSHTAQCLVGITVCARQLTWQTTHCRADLVLDWVYGRVLSAGDVSRQLATFPLGRHSPTAHEIHLQLVKALQQQADWDAQAQQYKQLLQDMLQTRKRYQELKEQYSSTMGPGCTAWPKELPDEVSQCIVCGCVHV